MTCCVPDVVSTDVKSLDGTICQFGISVWTPKLTPICYQRLRYGAKIHHFYLLTAQGWGWQYHMCACVRWCGTKNDAIFCIQMMSLMTWQTMESVIPTSTANWHLSNTCPLPVVSFLTEAHHLGQWIILHIDYTQQHYDPSKRPPSTTQQVSTVTNCRHMPPADHASPLFWSRSKALFQLWKRA